MNTKMKKHDKRNKPAFRSSLAAKFQNAVSISVGIPIGVFWDIENCQVPRGKSTIALVHAIRQKFFNGHKEAEFMCVCDIGKENKDVIKELNLAQVTVVHVNATCKNAADDKLKQCMRRFVDIHGSPSTVVLISTDVNFATDLSDFRHRHKVNIIIVHSDFAPAPLIACANEHYNFSEITSSLPFRSPSKSQSNGRSCELLVSGIPMERDMRSIHQRLKQLSDNCGGRVLSVVAGTAVLRFSNADNAQRARKRMDKEDIFGNKISVIFSPQTNERDLSPLNAGSKTSLSSRSNSSREASPVYHRNNESTNGSKFFEPGTQRNETSREISQQDCNFNRLANDQNRKSSQHGINQSYLPDLNSFGQFGSVTTSSCANLSDRFNTQQPQLETFNLSKSLGNLNNEQRVSPISHDYQSTSQSSKNGIYCKIPSISLSAQKNVGRVSPFIMNEQRLKGDSNGLSPYSGKAIGSHLSSSYEERNPPRPQSPFDFALPLHPQSQNLEQQQNLQNSSIFKSYANRQPSPLSFGSSHGIELLVTNLDQSIDINEMKKILFAAFKEHVMVLHISMMIQPDGTYKAAVRLPTMQDAQLSISQLHRRRIGHKRILISYTSSGKIAPLYVVKAEVASLLNDVPTRKMPLFKFRELFESRYHRSIGISELYKLSDTIQICDDHSGRMINLVPGYRATPSPVDFMERIPQESMEKPICELHMPLPECQGWAECESVYQLPDVCLSLKALAPKVHTLLDTHQGTVPLNSFCACYQSEFGELPVADAAKQKTFSPLEHLLRCIPGVEVARSALGIKRVQWLENRATEGLMRSISPALANPLALFSREMVDLLKNQTPRCAIPFNKLVPSYHHHFGRQCRVADYGYTKLIDLLEAIPQVIEILGQGQSRLLTLTHKTQIKRFASDLLRVLKSLPSKQLKLSQFAEFYLGCFEKEFEVSHYGVCNIMDLIGEVSENLVVLQSDDDTIVGIPKREQTPEEMERTKQFAADVVDLLRHTPSCSLSFNKFIPSYHHHFGRQCRVSYYGFSKLIELLEAIPEFLEVHGIGEDKILTLTLHEKLKILGERVAAVVKASLNCEILMTEFPKAYMNLQGHALHLEDFSASSIPQLVGMLKNIVKVEDRARGPTIVLINRTFVNKVSLRLRHLLMETTSGEACLEAMREAYVRVYGAQLDINSMLSLLDDGLVFKDGKLKLTPLHKLGRNLLLLLQRCGGHMSLQSLESEFLECFGVPCQPAQHGFSSIGSLLQAFPEYFTIKGRRGKKTVLLNTDSKVGEFFAISRSGQQHSINKESDFLLRRSPLDIFSQPIPSLVPSPELCPVAEELLDRNLMGFETPFLQSPDSMTCMSESEKMEHRTFALCDPANSLYYGQQPKAVHNQDPLRHSPIFAPMPPASWLTTAPIQTSPTTNESFSFMDSESDGSLSSPQSKLRPRSRIAAYFAIPLDK